MKKNLIGLISIGGCICFIIMMAFIIPTTNEPKPNIEDLQRIFTVDPSYFSPEPRERFLYIICTLALPILCALLYFSLSRLFVKLRLYKFRRLYWLLAFEVVVISIAYLFILVFSARWSFNYLKGNLLTQNPILALILSTLLLLTLLIFQFDKKWILKFKKFVLNPFSLILGVVLTILVSIVPVFNEADKFVPRVHFVAYFDSVVQVFLGKALLVDITPQYGLYALILKPIFKVSGLSVFNFTIVMALLTGVTYLSIFILLQKATRSKLISFVGFATILFFLFFLGIENISIEPYFQYYPHRMVFPAIFILLLWFYIVEKNSQVRKILYWILSLFCALSVIWNMDSGLVVMLTWLAYASFEELLTFRAQKWGSIIFKCLEHLGVIVGCTIVALSIFAFYTYFTAGQWPNFGNLALYIKLFYFYGYFLMPMRPIHSWNVLVLVYIIGLFISLSFLLDQNGFTFAHVSKEPKDQAFYKLTFALSVLGIGLFNYFVGRSHDYNLLAVCWVGLILLTIFTDRLFNELSRIFLARSIKWTTKVWLFFRHNDKVFFFLLLFYFFSSSAWSILPSLPALQALVSSRLSAAAEGMPSFLGLQIQFINSSSNTNDPVFILSDYAPELSLYTQHDRPLPISGFDELVLQSELKQINDFLSKPPENAKIYWAPSFVLINPNYFINLTRVAATEDGSLILFENNGR